MSDYPKPLFDQKQELEIRQNILDSVKQIITLRLNDFKRSRASQGRDLGNWANFINNESLELEIVSESNSNSIKTELGDVLGNVIAALIIAEHDGISVKDAANDHVNKFKERKPWIFPGYQYAVPPTPNVENAEWERRKKHAKTTKDKT